MTEPPARWLVLLAALACSSVGARASEPLRVWEVDFDDPAEAARWTLQPGSGVDMQVEWEIVDARPTAPRSGSVLEIRGSQGPGISGDAKLHRILPGLSAVDPDSALVLEVEWLIGDTDRSDAVLVGPLVEVDGRLEMRPTVLSHTRYTFKWRVFFDPSNTWVRHRIGIPSRFWSAPERAPLRGVALGLLDPVNQVVRVARLRIEEWPADAVETSPVFLPRRVPPAQRYEPQPLSSLRRAVAGALEDLDGDGLPELLVLERRGHIRLYGNDGQGGFGRERTGAADLDVPVTGTGALFVDLDGDRDRDLVVVGEYDVPRFFENRGGLRFSERKLVDDRMLGMWSSACADDPDGDGDVDLLFSEPYLPPFYLESTGRWNLAPASLLAPQPSPGGFVWNVSAAFADVDRDDRPEVLVGGERLYRNEGGVLRPDRQPWKRVDPSRTEGVVFADLSDDGEVDVLIVRDAFDVRDATAASRSARLLVNDGTGRFAERPEHASLPPLESAEVALVEDFDNDGRLDIYVCQRNNPNYLLLGQASGEFVDATERFAFGDLGRCDSALAGDLDGDGDMDLVLLRYHSPPRVLVNRTAAGRWLGVVVEGNRPDTNAIGTEVRAVDPESGRLLQVRWVRRGRGFGSNGPGELRFGLGDHERADLEVRFPGGARRAIAGVAAGATVLVREPAASVAARVADRLAEAGFPRKRAYRRGTAQRPGLVWGIALLAFLVGMLIPRQVRILRLVLVLVLGAGLLAAAGLGSAPGMGLRGTPAALWGLGGAAGLGATAAVGVVRHWAKRRSALRARAGSIEDFMREAQDFRHAGLEARNVLSIHNRAQNLFLRGTLHEPFVAKLRELAERFREASAPRILSLLERSRAVFPDLATEPLRRSVTRLDGALRRLPGSGSPQAAFRGWRDEVLACLEETRERLRAWLDELDRACSCDVRAVVEEVRAARSEALRAAEVTTEVRFEPAQGPLRAVVAREDLRTILENLFTNAMSFLQHAAERRIEVAATREPSGVRIEFGDTGRGVCAEDAARIFEYGFSRRRGGKGYGLARSREILGHYGGSIELSRAAADRGARFVLTLRSAPPA